MTCTETPHYRDGTAAGHKGNSPKARQNSGEAAEKVNATLERRQAQMLSAWRPYGAQGATPEQIADDLSLPFHIVRPRAGELVRKGRLFELERRMGGLGHKVTAYGVVPPNAGAS